MLLLYSKLCSLGYAEAARNGWHDLEVSFKRAYASEIFSESSRTSELELIASF